MDKIPVDFVGNDQEAVLPRRGEKDAKFFIAPDGSPRIVGRTEKHHGHPDSLMLRVLQGLVEARGAEDVASSFVHYQRQVDYPASVVADYVIEGVIHGGHDEDAVGRFGKSPHRDPERRDQARTRQDVPAIDRDAVPVRIPADQGFEESGACHRVAVHRMPGPIPECFDDFGRGGEVHVGDPERHDVGKARVFFQAVPFQGS